MGGVGGATGSGGAAGGGGAGGAGGGGPRSLLVPAQGALFGSFVGTGTVADLESTLGRRLAIVHHFIGWTDDFVALAREDLLGARIPLISWEPWDASLVGTPLDDIISGVHDAMILTRAQGSRDAGGTFFLRFAQEMNGSWYPWDGFHNGANLAATAKYVAAYQHIHDVFVGAGATNVVWVFSPNVDTIPPQPWNVWQNYYPGDTYVDWMGWDGYNWGTSQANSTWQAFSAIAGRIYASLAVKGKPIMIPETASSELGGDKAAWISAVLPSLQSSFPAIKALVWFHVVKETDWRVDSTPASRTAFTAMVNNPYFNP